MSDNQPQVGTCPTCRSDDRDVRKTMYHPTEDAQCFDSWHDPQPTPAEPRIETEVSEMLGKYLNTMVADLRIDGKRQYLRELFSKYEAELGRARAGSSLSPSPVAPDNREEEFARIIAAPGVPRNPSQRLPAEIYGRYKAGDSVADLADDYELPWEQIHWGIRIGYLIERISDAGSDSVHGNHGPASGDSDRSGAGESSLISSPPSSPGAAQACPTCKSSNKGLRGTATFRPNLGDWRENLKQDPRFVCNSSWHGSPGAPQEQK